jgi:hypothetical protein
MKNRKKHIQWVTTTGDPVERDGLTVTPISKALVIDIPYLGFVWNRPVSLLVDDGQNAKKVPIIDVTRVIQLTLITTAVILTVVSFLVGRRKSS